jgi:Zn-dependent protease
VHEAAHALAALKLGDPTAYLGGQVTLNPLPHVRREPVGTVVVPLLCFVLTDFSWMMGWASAPYDPVWARRHPRREVAMALAGPAANFALALAAGLALALGKAAGVFAAPDAASFDRVVDAVAGGGGLAGVTTVLSILFSLNLLLGLFNLLPLPPLDGSAVLALLLGAKGGERYRDLLAGQPALSLVGLVVAWRLFPPVFDVVFTLALNVLHPGAGYG